MRKWLKQLIILVLTPFSVTAWAGNGSGYGGPTFEGESIPLRLERAVPFELTQAAITCMTGDPRRGIEGFLRPIFEAAKSTFPPEVPRAGYERLLSASAFYAAVEDPIDNPILYGLASILKFVTRVDRRGQTLRSDGVVKTAGFYNQNPVQYVQRDVQGERDFPAVDIAFFQGSREFIIELNRKRPNERRLRLEGGLPYLAFTGMHEESYAFMGTEMPRGRPFDYERDSQIRRVESKRYVVNTMTVHLPSGLRKEAPLVDAKTGDITPYVVNTEQYVECLQSVIQRGIDETERSEASVK